MTRRYGISRYLTADEKARAVAAEYVPTPMVASERTQLRTVENKCPLGVALADGSCSPAPEQVEEALWRLGRGSPSRLFVAALHFIRAWDQGRIPPAQLAAALGVSA